MTKIDSSNPTTPLFNSQKKPFFLLSAEEIKNINNNNDNKDNKDKTEEPKIINPLSSLSNIFAKLNKPKDKGALFSSFYDNKFVSSNPLQSTPTANNKLFIPQSISDPILPLQPTPSAQPAKETTTKPSKEQTMAKFSTSSSSLKGKQLSTPNSSVSSASAKVNNKKSAPSVAVSKPSVKSSKSSVSSSSVQSKVKSSISGSYAKKAIVEKSNVIKDQITSILSTNKSSKQEVEISRALSIPETISITSEVNKEQPTTTTTSITDKLSFLDKFSSKTSQKDEKAEMEPSFSAFASKSFNPKNLVSTPKQSTGKTSTDNLSFFSSFTSKTPSKTATPKSSEKFNVNLNDSSVDLSLDTSMNQSRSSHKPSLTVPISPILNTKIRAQLRSQQRKDTPEELELMEIEQRKKELGERIEQIKREKALLSTTTSVSSKPPKQLTTPKEFHFLTEERSRIRSLSSLNTSVSSDLNDSQNNSFSLFKSSSKSSRMSSSSSDDEGNNSRRLRRSLSDRSLTEPKEFHFRTEERSQIRRASKTALEDREIKIQNHRESIQWTGELTQPKEFHFHTADRMNLRTLNHDKSLSVEEKIEKEMKNYHFKALPLNRKIFDTNGELGVPRLEKLPLTVAHSPLLHTKQRAKLRKISNTSMINDENAENMNFSVFDRSKSKFEKSSFYDSSSEDESDSSTSKRRRSSSRKSLTEPKPFHFATEDRAALRQLQKLPVAYLSDCDDDSLSSGKRKRKDYSSDCDSKRRKLSTKMKIFNDSIHVDLNDF